MNFFSNMFGGRKDNSPEPMTANKVLKATQFVMPESQLLVDEPLKVGYLSDEHVAYLLRLNKAPDWNFDLRDIEGAKNFYGAQCSENKGAMLNLTITKVDGAEALQGLFKYRNPENPLSIAYVGILWVPFADACLQINVEAVERGTTGIREALVMTMMMKDGTFVEPQPFEPPTKVSGPEEMFKMMREKPLVAIPSDDEKFDSLIPQHPLTLVRKNLNTVANTLQLETGMRSLQPFRHDFRA